MVAVGSLVKAMQQLLITLALIVRASSNLSRKTLYLSLKGKNDIKSLGGLLNKGSGIVNNHLLWQVAYRAVGIARNSSRCGLLKACNEFENSSLTRAIATNKSYALLWVYQKRYGVKEGPAPKADREVIY